MKRKSYSLTLVMLAVLWPLLAFPQHVPLVYWRFEGTNPWADFSTDSRPIRVGSPWSGSSFWVHNGSNATNGGIMSGGPVGNYVRVRAQQIDLSGSQQPEMPTSWNPDGLTAEFIFRYNGLTSKTGTAFALMPRISMEMFPTEILLICFMDCNTQTTFRVPLTGLGRLHENYLRDGNWHHMAIRYSFRPDVGKGEIALYMDGATLPEMRFVLNSRLRFRGLTDIYLMGSIPQFRNIDVDEMAIFDEAIPEDLIHQHAKDFTNGVPYRVNMDANDHMIVLNNQPTFVYDVLDYVPGYDPNNPPAGPAAPTKTLNEQLTLNYQLPRYKSGHQLMRNHLYAGQMGQLESGLEPSGTRNQKVAANIWELHKNWNYSAGLGAIQSLPGEITNGGSILNQILNTAPTNPYYSITSSWKGAKSTTNAAGAACPWIYTNVPGGMSNIPGAPPAEDFYLINSATPAADFVNLHSSQILTTVTTPSGECMRPNAATHGATEDGKWMGARLKDLRNHNTNAVVKYIIENGEVPPNQMASATANTLLGTGNPRDADLYADWTTSNPYNNPVQTAATPVDNWKQWVSNGKYNLDAAYRDGILTASDYASNSIALPSFNYYQSHGRGPWHFKPRHQISQHQSNLRNAADQQYYSMSGMYIDRAYAWDNRRVAGNGLLDIVWQREEEVPLVVGTNGNAVRTGHFPYFSPSVSPGIDEGNANGLFGLENRETQMMRPGYYLGLLKATAVLGAEYFIAFQYNQFSQNQQRPHDAAWWGWQIAIPSYAQATMSQVDELYRNSVIMDGNMGVYQGGSNQMRFWAGNTNYVVMARQGVTSAENVDCESYDCTNAPNVSTDLQQKFLITGTIQSKNESTKHAFPTSDYPESRELSKVVTVRMNNQDLKFEIRKQGSTYYYDYTDPSEPVFYQIDKWHEHSHPSHWTKDVVLDAEVEFNQPSQSVYFKRHTRNTFDEMITNGDYSAFATYLALPNDATSNMEVSFRLRTRDIANGYPMVRARTKDPNATLAIEVIRVTGNQVVVPYTTINLLPSCWNWYSPSSNSISLPDDEYIIKIFTAAAAVQIDKVAIVKDGNQGPYLATVNQPTHDADFVKNGNTLPNPLTICNGDPITLRSSLTTSGVAPWSYRYGDASGNGVTVTNIFTSTHSVTLFPAPTDMVDFWAVRDINCYEGVVDPAIFTATNNTPAPVTLTPATVTCYPTSVSAPGGFTTYSWSSGQSTQSINVDGNGVYIVTMTDNAGCRTVGRQIVATSAAFNITSSSPDGFILCNGNSITLQAPTGATSYAWTLLPNTPMPSTTNTCTVSVAGTYELVAVNNGCTITKRVQVNNAEALIQEVGYVCSTTPQFTFRASPTTGTWSSSPAGVSSTGVFNPATVNFGGNSSVTYTVTYTVGTGNCLNCPNITDTYTMVVYNNCINPCDIEGGNLAPNGSFTDLPCNASPLPFVSPLTLNCAGSLNFGQYMIDGTSNASGMSGSFAEHSANTPSRMLIAKRFNNTSDHTIWKQSITLEAGTHAIKVWARIETSSSCSLKLVINNSTSIALGAVTDKWSEFLGTYNATSAGSYTFEIMASAGSGGEYMAIDDISITKQKNSLSIMHNAVACTTNNAPFELRGLISEPVSSAIWSQTSPNTVPGLSSALIYNATFNPNTVANTFKLTVVTTAGCTLEQHATVTPVPCSLKTAEPVIPTPSPTFTLFPNPNNGLFTLQGQMNGAKDLRIRVMSMHGVTVFSRDEHVDAEEYDKTIDLQGVASGIYYLVAEGQGFRQVLRVVKQ